MPANYAEIDMVGSSDASSQQVPPVKNLEFSHLAQTKHCSAKHEK